MVCSLLGKLLISFQVASLWLNRVGRSVDPGVLAENALDLIDHRGIGGVHQEVLAVVVIRLKMAPSSRPARGGERRTFGDPACQTGRRSQTDHSAAESLSVAGGHKSARLGKSRWLGKAKDRQVDKIDKGGLVMIL
jgi:hypothetical protein